MRSSERNRYQNCMTVSNIGLSSILSDPFGKSATAIMNEVLSSNSINESAIKKLIHGTCAKKTDAILASLKDSRIESDQKLKMNVASKHMQELSQHIEQLEVELMKRCSPMLDSFFHITKLPGISSLAAMIIISEIGVDMSQFQSDRQLCCWAGLAPANNESAGKKYSVRISKAGCYLKPLLVQCALSAIKSNKETYFRIKYDRIKKRRGHKKAIVAIARMLLVSIYHMIQTGEDFNPSDYDSLKNPIPSKSSLTPEIALGYLRSLGVDISSLQLPI